MILLRSISPSQTAAGIVSVVSYPLEPRALCCTVPAQLDTMGFEGQRSRGKADIVRRPRAGDPTFGVGGKWNA